MALAITQYLHLSGNVSFTGVALGAFIFLGLIIVGFWLYQNNRWRYDVGLWLEKANGAVIYQRTKGRIFLKDGLNIYATQAFPHREHPAPTLDALIPAGQRAYFEVWVDPVGNFHQVRKTRNAPVLVDNDGMLEQLRAEMPSPIVRQRGWFSKLLKRDVREVLVGEKREPKFVYIDEIVFEPDSRSSRAWTWNALRRNTEKHQSVKWWQDRVMIIIMILCVFCILAIIGTGYYYSEIYRDAAARMSSAIGPALETLSRTLTVIGG